jgi:hypothetical protein
LRLVGLDDHLSSIVERNSCDTSCRRDVEQGLEYGGVEGRCSEGFELTCNDLSLGGMEHALFDAGGIPTIDVESNEVGQARHRY